MSTREDRQPAPQGLDEYVDALLAPETARVEAPRPRPEQAAPIPGTPCEPPAQAAALHGAGRAAAERAAALPAVPDESPAQAAAGADAFSSARPATEAEAVYRAMLDARALLDSAVVEREDKSGGFRCIAFRVAGELYAIDLGAVREVILPPEIVPVPGAGREILGVINLRGNVVTVINSRAELGLGGLPEGPGARVLVLDDDAGCVGALVDAVEDIIFVKPDDLAPVRGASRPQIQAGGALTVGEEIAFLIGGAALVGEPAAGSTDGRAEARLTAGARRHST